MRLAVFTEGTIIMHRTAAGKKPVEIIKQVQKDDPEVQDYAAYIPVKCAVSKLSRWQEQGAKICYLTSNTEEKEVAAIKQVLRKYEFPEGKLWSRQPGESYRQVLLKAQPDIFLEDDCQSIGGEKETCAYQFSPAEKRKIKFILLPEFGGIDHLPDSLAALVKYNSGKNNFIACK